jgi:putative secretion ATPase (PEP-CTERM system associated)
MYDTFYKLKGRPFQLSPDPRFFFKSQSHKRALAYLLYGVHQSEGFVVVTGDVGTGKTTLVQALFRAIQHERVVAAQIVSTQVQEDDLLRMVAAAYGLAFENVSKAGLLRGLEGFFRSCHQERRRVLLVVDEVQNLTPRAIEELRMLSNFQAGGRMLLQSFLLGQKEFRMTMRAPNFEQLRQRVIAAYHLQPLETPEVRGYVEHRLQLVGWRDDPSVTEEAYEAIHRFTDGIPRRINTLCDRLFLHGAMEELHTFTEETLDTVTSDLVEELGGIIGAEVSGTSSLVDPLAGEEAELGARNVVGFRHHGPGAGTEQERLRRVETSVAALGDAMQEELAQLRRAIQKNPGVGTSGGA